MWTVWGVLAPILPLLLVVGFLLSDRFRGAQASWRLLSLSGWFLSAFGLVWILRAWNPTLGPYRIGDAYPFGTHLQAWQVTFGFTWLAFGFLFFVAVLFAAGRPTRVAWATLLVSWLVCMLPHAVIAVALAWTGEETAQAVDLPERVSSEAQPLLIVATVAAAFLLLASSIGGFLWTAWQLLRRPCNKPLQPTSGAGETKQLDEAGGAARG